MNTSRTLVMWIVLAVGACISPTRAIIDYWKKHHRNRALLFKRWNMSFFCISIVISLTLYVLPIATLPRPAGFPMLSAILWVVLWCSVSRCTEVFWAFGRDAFDQLEGKAPTSGLTAPNRLRLVAVSYAEVILDFGLICFSLSLLVDAAMYTPSFASIADAIYFSAMTITTVGYGDITPTRILSRALAISEVVLGLVLVVLALGVYLSQPSRQPLQGPLPINVKIFRWHYSGMVADVRSAIAGRANFLCALGLLVYTEVLGRDILKRRGQGNPGRSESFYCFWEEFMRLPRAPADKVYEHFRHGLAHTYEFLAVDESIVAMNPNPDAVPGDSVNGINVSADGKVKAVNVNAYWRDFQRGMIRFAESYPDILA
jgi:voltage-gated potassium channel